MTNAVSGNLTHSAREMANKAMGEHGDLTGTVIAGLIAAILFRLATAAAQPRAGHAVLAVLGALAIVFGFLLVARSKVASEWKLVTVAGTAVLSALCFHLLTMLTG